MSTAITSARADTTAALMEQVVVNGDLASLSPQQRVTYYMRVCESLGLNPLTKPFDYIRLNGKLTLYTRKDATDQLRKLNNVSITRVERELVNEVYVVTAYATTRDGREDSDVGAVSVKGLSGEALANAYMKAMTKAKRRVTLSICGLGMLDELEVETIPDAQHIAVDTATGEIVSPARPAARMTRDEIKARWQEQNDTADALGIGEWQHDLPTGQNLPMSWYVAEVERRTNLIAQAETVIDNA